uniref:type IV pilus modification PilV family protein n=1 Tax=Thaumasiovibrio occultus TaxID=1891184 RepID=UPI000B3573D9|nr:prepilin-type N-terminal cleavage/methylation domain-containing protein [Thaumasiovibrio occultus]
MISKHRGFGLLEALIALIVLSVGVVGLIRLQVYIDRKADYAIASIDALAIAEEKLEYFRTRSTRDGVSEASGTIYFDGPILEPNTYNQTVSGAGLTYNYSLETKIRDTLMLPGPGTTSAAAKTIDVTVQWTDNWNETHEVALKTMVSRYSEFN